MSYVIVSARKRRPQNGNLINLHIKYPWKDTPENSNTDNLQEREVCGSDKEWKDELSVHILLCLWIFKLLKYITSKKKKKERVITVQCFLTAAR